VGRPGESALSTQQFDESTAGKGGLCPINPFGKPAVL